MTVRDIITQALRRARIIPLDEQPTAAEADNGLLIMQGWYDSLFQGQFFGPMNVIYKSGAYTANEFDSIYADGATITIPDTITENGEVRAPKDLAAIVINDGTVRNYIFDVAWIECSNLTLDIDAPFSTRGADGLACAIASQWVDAFGGELSQQVYDRGTRFKSSLMRLSGMTFDDHLPSVSRGRYFANYS